MAYQNIEARFLVTFDNPEDAARLVKESVISLPGVCFEVNMTEKEKAEVCEKTFPQVELLFSGQFHVGVTKGWSGSRTEPPEPPEVEGFVQEEDVVSCLKAALCNLGITIRGEDIECMEYESDGEQDILDKGREYGD